MKAAFRNIMFSGIQDRLNHDEQVKLLFVNSTIFFGLTVLGIFWIRDFSAGRFELGAVTLGVSGIIAALFFAIRIFRSPTLGAWFLPFLMFGFYTYLTAAGSANSSGVLWMLTYPVIVLFMVGPLWGSVLASVFLAVQTALFFAPGLSPVSGTDFDLKVRLLGVYIIVFSFSMAFEVIRRQTQRDLARTAAELAAAKVQTDGILTNVSEGIFLLEKDLTIGDQHSRSLGPLLDTDVPAGKSLITLLTGRIGEQDLKATAGFLEMFFLPHPPWDLIEGLNPLAEVSFVSPHCPETRLTFSFSPVELSTGRRILGTVRDITQEFELGRKLREEEDRSARQMKQLFQIIHVRPELLLQFLQDADEEIDQINRLLKNPKVDLGVLVESLFQGVHAVKGNASLVGLTTFAARVHDLETVITAFRGKEPAWNDFLEMTVQLSLIQSELTEIRQLLVRMTAFQRGLEASVEARDLLVLTLERAVDRMGRDTGLGVELDVKDFNPGQVPERHRKLVKDVLVQFVRNSFAHGFEPAGERESRGKAARPVIRVSAAARGAELALVYRDDGRGIDVSRLRQAAAALPEWAGRDVSSLSDDQAQQLIFASGVSTAQEAGLHAGRGVGLGLVKERVEATGGRIRFKSAPGRGVAFQITLPLA